MTAVSDPSPSSLDPVPTSSEKDTWPFEDPERARAHARETDRPMFVYWSAKWCPPCAELQVSVLRRAPFRSRWTRFVPLAVDGDAPGAQAYGERIDANVYPTMMLLDNAERIWIRMPCGLQESTFCSVIDAALRQRTPIGDLAHALSNRRSLSDDKVIQLVFHYWPLEQRVFPDERRLAFMETLDEAASAFPGRLLTDTISGSGLSARALAWHLVERASRSGTLTSPALRAQLTERFVELLRSDEATYSTLYYVLVGLTPVLRFLRDGEPNGLEPLIDSLSSVLERFVDDELLSWTERLIAQSALINLRTPADFREVSKALQERTRRLTAMANADTASVIERQSVMNMAGHLLKQVGLLEDSITLFRAEIDRSPWPTYFMPHVAETYLELGERDEAIRWWRRAYEDTVGPTTRFELGVRYVAALVQHAALERSTIEGTVTRLLGGPVDGADLGRGRLRRSLGTLNRTLSAWTP